MNSGVITRDGANGTVSLARMRQPLAPALDDLKRRLRTEPDLAKLMDAFFDLVEATDLAERSKPARNPRLEKVLQVVLGTIAHEAGSELAVLTPSLCAEHGIDHGALIVGGAFGAYFYFRELDRGVCSVGTLDGRVHAFRFTIMAGAVPVASTGDG